MSRFLLRLRLSIRWRLFVMAVLVAYCLPVGCVALLVIRLPAGGAAAAPTLAATEAPAQKTTLTYTPLSAFGSPTDAPTIASAAPENDPTWDYRQSVDLRAELCARLNVPVRSEAYRALCAIRVPIEENTAAPIIAYLESAFLPGTTMRAEIDAYLGAYQSEDGVYDLPVRVENGRTVVVRVAFAFDETGVYTGFDADAGTE